VQYLLSGSLADEAAGTAMLAIGIIFLYTNTGVMGMA